MESHETDSTDSEIRAEKPTKTRWSMSVVNFWVDSVLLLVLVTFLWISVTLRFVFPLPTSAKGWTLWGQTYDQWADYQFICLCVLCAGVLVHLMLHWNWICSVMTAQILKTRARINDSMQTIYGVGLLILILHVILAGLIFAMYSVKKPGA